MLPARPGVIDTIWLLHRVKWPMSAHAERAVQALEAFITGLGN